MISFHFFLKEEEVLDIYAFTRRSLPLRGCAGPEQPSGAGGELRDRLADPLLCSAERHRRAERAPGHAGQH